MAEPSEAGERPKRGGASASGVSPEEILYTGAESSYTRSAREAVRALQVYTFGAKPYATMRGGDLVHEFGDRRQAVREGVRAFRQYDEERTGRGGAEDVRAAPRAGRGALAPGEAGVAGGSGRNPGGARCRFSLGGG